MSIAGLAQASSAHYSLCKTPAVEEALRSACTSPTAAHLHASIYAHAHAWCVLFSGWGDVARGVLSQARHEHSEKFHRAA